MSLKLETIETILVRRDGVTMTEASAIVQDLKERVWLGQDPEELLEEIGLEPDYVFELLS